MKLTLFITLLLCTISMGTLGQQTLPDTTDYTWIEQLTDGGISIINDSVHISPEAKRILEDSVYRVSIYPENYEWPATMKYIQNRELKKAFWYMINLYSQNEVNKDLVVKAMVTYNAIFDMNIVLKNTFYTYCYTDPEISKMINGKPVIHAPHVLDSKLQVLKELTLYMARFKPESEKILLSTKKD